MKTFFMAPSKPNILQRLKTDFISDMSACVLNEPVSQERQCVVNNLVDKFSKLKDAEKLLFFLLIPPPTTQTGQSKNPGFGSRAEIRQTSAWIKTHLQENKHISIPKKEVYEQYTKYCEASKMKIISTADFGKVMKQVYPNVRPRRLGTRGNSQYCYAGMSNSVSIERPVLYGMDADTEMMETIIKQEDCSNHMQTLQSEEYATISENGFQKDCSDNEVNFSAGDCQIEEELAQYFPNGEQAFVMPRKISSKTERVFKSALHRSQSVGVNPYNELTESGVYHRSYSSENCGGNVKTFRDSLDDNQPRYFPQIQKLLQRPLSSCRQNLHSRFTPIPLKHNAGTRPKSCSSNATKYGFKRNQGDFVKPEFQTTPIYSTPNPRSQSLPYFGENKQYSTSSQVLNQPNHPLSEEPKTERYFCNLSSKDELYPNYDNIANSSNSQDNQTDVLTQMFSLFPDYN